MKKPEPRNLKTTKAEAFISGQDSLPAESVNQSVMPWNAGLDNTCDSEKNVNVLLTEHYREAIKKLHTLSPKYHNGKHLMQLILCEGVDKLIAELEQDKNQE